MRRQPMRVRGLDYSAEGFYFVTACAQGRDCIFGDIVGEAVRLSPVGIVARDCLVEIPAHHGDVEVDSFVVMPNHVHALFAMSGSSPTSLSVVTGTYKAAVARRSNRSRLWQRGYYDHVVRDEDDLERIREYIEVNPVRWVLDPENPSRSS